ncbi:MAG TPA: DUF427 domain-containing protein [Solirubrobacteraceae bacterium]|jgi:uncharacterized protein (DUF427 family)|nr:DUF427 domain-containing protein [Solirubrobacteraceae bacterium]
MPPGPPAFDIPVPEPRVEPTPRWIRVRDGERWVADSRRALLLVWYGPGLLPTYCFPDEDVADPARARRLEGLPAPLAAAEGLWTFPWDGSVQWFEEATEVLVHARDPSKRVDAVPSERHVRVERDGELLAESRRPTAVFETWLPTRWYLPPGDVRWSALSPSDTVTRCPYKGTARFWSAAGRADVAWSYPEPIPECPRIAGLVAFFDEHVDLTVDGEPQRRPFTPWSLDARG